MTNEEAIKIIKSECYTANLLNLDRTRMVNTALDLAIKALKQQPKIGHWIDIWDKNDYDVSTQGRCSRCRQISDRPLGEFCKWCGAKMEEEQVLAYADQDTLMPAT